MNVAIKRLAFIILATIVFLFQSNTAFGAASELSASVSVTQRLDWLPFPEWHPLLTHETFDLVVTLRAQSDFSGGFFKALVVPAAAEASLVYVGSEYELGVLKKGETIALKWTFQTSYAGFHCIKFGFSNLPGRADNVTILVGAVALGDNCVASVNFWDKNVFLAGVPAILLAGATVVLVVVTGYYAQQTKRLVEETRKDRRRRLLENGLEKVYSPMFEIFRRALIDMTRPRSAGSSFSFKLSELDQIRTIVERYGHYFDQRILGKIRVNIIDRQGKSEWQLAEMNGLYEHIKREFDRLREELLSLGQ